MNADQSGAHLNELLARAGLEPLDDGTANKFEAYVSLIIRWNAYLNLTSVRAEDGIISIHLADSITCARALPIGVARLLDFGSGAGLPGIPIALCRSEIVVTLAESQGKKAAFLQEAVRVLEMAAKVYSGRAETIPEVFDCVTLRAVDKMPKAVSLAVPLVAPRGWLALMTTDAQLSRLQVAAGASFLWTEPSRLPCSESRLLALGQRISS